MGKICEHQSITNIITHKLCAQPLGIAVRSEPGLCNDCENTP